jgi:hypothetical protein
MDRPSENKKTGKRLRFLPLIAFVMGLCAPIYAYAQANEADCTYCHNACSNPGIASYCYNLINACNNCPYGPYQCTECYEIDACFQNTVGACHAQCETPGGPCVD